MCHPLLLIGFLVACSGQDVVHSPPPDAIVEKFDLSPFYGKCLLVEGMPIVSSDKVRDEALLEAAFLIRRMIGHRPEILRAMAENRTRFTIMAPTEYTTDVPEHSDLAPSAYWDKRARGLGATFARPSVSCGEENLLCLPGDPYSTENILIHEFGHAIHEMGMVTVDPTFDSRLMAMFRKAMDEGLYRNKYAATNRMEYWAESVQSWFDTNRENDHDHNHVDTREELKQYDPRMAIMLEEIFEDGAWRYVRPGSRTDPAHLAGYTGDTRTFAWPPEMVAAYKEHQKQQHRMARRDGESEVDHVTRLAEAGIASFQVRLGWLHRDGQGVPQDDAMAVHWFRKATEQGDADAQDHLGWMYKSGRGVPMDDAEAITLFRRSAQQGHAQGMYNLGMMILEGRGTSSADPIEATAWFILASEHGGHNGSRQLRAMKSRLDQAQLEQAGSMATRLKDRSAEDAR
ncbi:MAG: hypothetical protein CMJ32_03540 [Phycisphaerae bacterium]|nr:hypothetical protein [Phycisphaerae bacterium]